MTIRRACLILLIVALASTAALASVDGRWLHVRIEGHDSDDAVSINVPLSLVATLIPMIESDDLKGGRIRIDDHWDDDGIDIRELLAAVRDAPDADFVTIRSRDESLRVAKRNGYLIVETDETTGGDETLNIRIPLRVVEAMFTTGDELDLMAGLEALADYDDEDLVLIRDGDEAVRIWIDSSETGR
jgi:hypothetical protein